MYTLQQRSPAYSVQGFCSLFLLPPKILDHGVSRTYLTLFSCSIISPVQCTVQRCFLSCSSHFEVVALKCSARKRLRGNARRVIGTHPVLSESIVSCHIENWATGKLSAGKLRHRPLITYRLLAWWVVEFLDDSTQQSCTIQQVTSMWPVKRATFIFTITLANIIYLLWNIVQKVHTKH